MNIDLEEGNLHEGVAIQGDPFLRDIYVRNTSHSTGCLLFICSYVVAIIPNYDRNGDLESFFLFHSHCRNTRGVTDNVVGYSVLLQFSNLFELEKYIEVAYDITNRSYPPYFQVQFIVVNIKNAERKKISRSKKLENVVLLLVHQNMNL